ncbi:MAG: flagellin FliC [Alkalimonas sp.]|nr:flagellin FliC [Alkalimonas sp.]
MALMVNTNQSSLTSQRMLTNATSGLSTSFERLSSGYRINRAADDAAGLVISGTLTNQISGLNQAVRNANDAVSLIQVSDSAIDEMNNSIQRMRTLAIQAENGINDESDLEALQQEFAQSKSLLNSIAEKTEFGGIKLLDGTAGMLDFMIGSEAGQKISIDMTTSYSTSANDLALDDISLIEDDAETVLAALDNALLKLDSARTDYGAIQNSLIATIKNLTNVSENVAGSRSRIKDTDYARETTELTRTQILQQSSTSVLSQANQRPQAALLVLNSS